MPSDESVEKDRHPDDDITVTITVEKTLSGKKAFDWASANATPDAHVEFVHEESGETINEWEPRE